VLKGIRESLGGKVPRELVPVFKARQIRHYQTALGDVERHVEWTTKHQNARNEETRGDGLKKFRGHHVVDEAPAILFWWKLVFLVNKPKK